MGGPGSGRRKGSGSSKKISKTDKRQIRSNKKLDSSYRKQLKKSGIDPATGNRIR